MGSEEFLELETARRGKTRLFYSARAGDTLAKIAKRYGLTPGDLARINRLLATTELHEGQRIVVYSPTPELPKEITAKVTGAPKKPGLAMKEVAPKNGKSAVPDHGRTTETHGAAKSTASPRRAPRCDEGQRQIRQATRQQRQEARQRQALALVQPPHGTTRNRATEAEDG